MLSGPAVYCIPCEGEYPARVSFLFSFFFLGLLPFILMLALFLNFRRFCGTRSTTLHHFTSIFYKSKGVAINAGMNQFLFFEFPVNNHVQSNLDYPDSSGPR